MPQMEPVGWIVVGLLAGWLSAAVVDRGGGPRGCLGNVVVGVLGGLLGGWFATSEMHLGTTRGFIAAVVVAFLGAAFIRLVLGALAGGRGRPPGPPRRPRGW